MQNDFRVAKIVTVKSNFFLLLLYFQLIFYFEIKRIMGDALLAIGGTDLQRKLTRQMNLPLEQLHVFTFEPHLHVVCTIVPNMPHFQFMIFDIN